MKARVSLKYFVNDCRYSIFSKNFLTALIIGTLQFYRVDICTGLNENSEYKTDIYIIQFLVL